MRFSEQHATEIATQFLLGEGRQFGNTIGASYRSIEYQWQFAELAGISRHVLRDIWVISFEDPLFPEKAGQIRRSVIVEVDDLSGKARFLFI